MFVGKNIDRRMEEILGSTMAYTSEIVCFSGIYFYIFPREKLRFFFFFLDLVIFLCHIFFFMHTNWYPTRVWRLDLALSHLETLTS